MALMPSHVWCRGRAARKRSADARMLRQRARAAVRIARLLRARAMGGSEWSRRCSSRPDAPPLLSLCALTGALLTVAATARADDPPAAKPLRWDLEWTHAGLADYALTGVGLGSLALELALLQPKQPPLHWTGPILFDQAVRDVLRGSTVEVRHTAASVSWGLLDVNMGYSLVVDVPYAWARYGPDVARDLFWQDSTALSLAGAADLALRDAVGAPGRPSATVSARGGARVNVLVTAPSPPAPFRAPTHSVEPSSSARSPCANAARHSLRRCAFA